jgi:hypothetical protein
MRCWVQGWRGWLGLLALVIVAGASHVSILPVAQAQAENSPPLKADAGEGSLFLPLVQHDAALLADRLGYGLGLHPLERFPTARSLRAGWYLNWATASNPVRPGGIEFAQVVFVHQALACGLVRHGDRAACPYAEPYDYVVSPALDQLQQIAQAQPGQLWLIGNEIDRRDWSYCAEFEADGKTCKAGQIRHDGQGEILPETYARAYSDIYSAIKAADPTARIGIGGVIQATPLRLAYLTLIWDAYQNFYGQAMPVDVWNVHNFILQEKGGNYGADIPPGLPGDPQEGLYLDNDCTHVDLSIFDQQIRAFRQWMKERGQQEKELLVTEYGVLYSHTALQPQSDCHLNFNDAALVHEFMLDSFDYFLQTQDCNLGYTADGCRLVQRWLWFSLAHGYLDDAGTPVHVGGNYHASLADAASFELTAAGQHFADYAFQNLNALDYPK